jgi:hypothetical protein
VGNTVEVRVLSSAPFFLREEATVFLRKNHEKQPGSAGLFRFPGLAAIFFRLVPALSSARSPHVGQML